jgi:hypothetical protein
MASELQGVKNALGFGVSLIAAEHFISAGMSSPWSVAKFAVTEEDAQQVWKLFTEAGIASVISAVILGMLLGDGEVFLWSLGGVAACLIFVGSEYKRALDGTL